MRGRLRAGAYALLVGPLACGPELAASDSEGGGAATSTDASTETSTGTTAAGGSETGDGDGDPEAPLDDCAPSDTLDGFISVQSPEELAQLSGVCGIDGSLYVRDSAQITSLEPLSSLEWVTGQLVVSELPALESLAGLSGLRETTGLILRGLPGLADLSGLDAFEQSAAIGLWDLPTLAGLDTPLTIGHTFTSQATLRFSVGAIADLDSLEQLPELELIPGRDHFDTMIVDIESSPQLLDLIGVERVLTEDPSQVDLWLRDLPITDLSGLEGQPILAGLSIRDLPALVSFAGSEDLVEIGHLLISGASSLPGFIELGGLERVEQLELGSYCINESGGPDDNPLLMDLSGLEGVAEIDLLTVSGLSSFDSFAGLSDAVQIGAARLRWNQSLAPATIDAFLLEHGLAIELPSVDYCGNLGEQPCPPCPGD